MSRHRQYQFGVGGGGDETCGKSDSSAIPYTALQFYVVELRAGRPGFDSR